MDTERNFLLLNIINKLENIQNDCSASSYIFATIKEELKNNTGLQTLLIKLLLTMFVII